MKKDEQEVSARGIDKVQEGVVVSNKAAKTIVVAVKTYKKHPQYGKYVQKTMRYMAHDENNECNIGDKVMIKETRPLSRQKRWRLTKVIEKVA
jgi:small subunit ribosomal protein S17